MIRLLAALTCVLGVLAPTTSFADWFALELGTVRRFEGPLTGETTVSRTTTIESIRSREVYRIENEVTGLNAQVFWNYWSIDGEGRLLLHGFKAGPDPEDFFNHYEPPIVYADASPTEGATWSTTFDVWTRDGGPTGGPSSYSGQSYGVEILDLAVGSFDALLTGSNPNGPVLRLGAGENTGGYSVTGRRISADGAARVIEAQEISWWVQGIGEVQWARFTSTNVEGSLTYASVPIEENTSGTSQLKSRYLQKD